MKALDYLKLNLKMYKPEIEVGFGLALSLCGLIDACKATAKANDIFEETKNDFAVLDRAMTDLTEEQYPKSRRRKDTIDIYSHTFKNMVKVYAAPAFIYCAGNALMLKSNSDYKKRTANLSAAYAAMSEAYRQYRKRIVDKYGQKVDDEIRYDIQHKKVTEEYVDEDGKTKKRKKDVPTANPYLMNPYTFIWDDGSSVEFDPDDEFWNKNFLTTRQNYFNDLGKSRINTHKQRPGWVTLNEVLSGLGMDTNFKFGQEVGWLFYPEGIDNPYGDNYIDFGLLEMYRDPNGDLCFINEEAINLTEKVWLLDFNAQGNILEVLKQF